MTTLRRRRAGLTVAMVTDLFREARQSGRWLLLAVVLVTLAAVAAGGAAQHVVPWAVYGGL